MGLSILLSVLSRVENSRKLNKTGMLFHKDAIDATVIIQNQISKDAHWSS